MITYDSEGHSQNLVGRKVIIYNKTLTSAATEYSQALPVRATSFTIQCRTAFDMTIAFAVGDADTTYMTIKSGASYTENNLDIPEGAAITIYMESAEAGVVAEIMAWTNH